MSDSIVTLADCRPTIDEADPDDAHFHDAVAVFGGVRARLIGIACRILGSWNEAEDIVQDAWMRWQLCDRATVRNPTAFLVTTTTRLAINAAQSARVRRELYVGEWLPEPVALGEDPTLGVERSEGLELGIRLLREQLTPMERGAYVLHEAFCYPYTEIATMLQTTEGNARKLASRATRHLAEDRHRSVGTVGATATRRRGRGRRARSGDRGGIRC